VCLVEIESVGDTSVIGEPNPDGIYEWTFSAKIHFNIIFQITPSFESKKSKYSEDLKT
jgi:hypothetical protein